MADTIYYTSASDRDTARRGFNDVVTRFWGVLPRPTTCLSCSSGFTARRTTRWSRNCATTSRRGSPTSLAAPAFWLTGSSATCTRRVYGVDMSEGMLSQARSRSSAVQWRRGPAEQLPFDDGPLDAVVTTSAFHFFDQPAALREFHRVLAPGGLVAVATMSSRQPFLRCPAGGHQHTSI